MPRFSINAVGVLFSGSGAPLPPALGGSGTALWTDNFSSYSGWSTGATPMTAVYAYEAGENVITLDPTGGPSGSQCMTIPWASNYGGACTDVDHLIEKGYANTKELYFRYDIKYSAGFKFDWSGTGGCSGNAKKLFLIPGSGPPNGTRGTFMCQNGHWQMYPDQNNLGVIGETHGGVVLGNQNVGTEILPSALGNGSWHTIVGHFKAESSAGAGDGTVEGWIDNVQKWSFVGIGMNNSTGWYDFQTPTVLNQGSPQTQQEWMANLYLWKP